MDKYECEYIYISMLKVLDNEYIYIFIYNVGNYKMYNRNVIIAEGQDKQFRAARGYC